MRGGVPIAEIVPISRMRSYTAMIITFITLTSTIDTSMILMNSVSKSIMRARLANGDRSAQVCTSSPPPLPPPLPAVPAVPAFPL